MRTAALFLILLAGCSSQNYGGSGSSSTVTAATEDAPDFREYVESCQKKGIQDPPVVGKTFTYRGIVKETSQHVDYFEIVANYSEFAGYALKAKPADENRIHPGDRLVFQVQFVDVGPATWSEERKKLYIQQSRNQEEERERCQAIDNAYPIPVGHILSWRRQ